MHRLFQAFLALFGGKPAWAALFFIVIASPYAQAQTRVTQAAQPAVNSAAPYSVRDMAGNSVDFARPPQRIVTLLPSLAETVCALGACSKIVGTDRYTTWPDALQKVSKVGGGLDPNIEAIVAFKPDVVLASSASRASARLRALGVRVVVLEPRTHAETLQVLQILGQVLGLPPSAAQGVWQTIQTEIQTAAATLPAPLKGKRVYFEVNRGPYAAGETSFIGETISALGLKNVVGKDLGPFPKLNPEFVVRQNPDFIMAGDRSAPEMMLYPGWKTLGAVQAGRVCLFSPEQADILIHPGPRLGQAAQLLSDCVQGRIAKPR
jgi:iron complex transport system substrate-binding protein